MIYNLFGVPSWANSHRLGMYNLVELKTLLGQRGNWQNPELARHTAILTTLRTVAKNYDSDIPEHWL